MSCIRNKSFIKNYKLRIHRKLKEIVEETECVRNLLAVELAKVQQKVDAIQQNNSDSFFDVYEGVNEDLDKFSEKLFLINNILCVEAFDDAAEDDGKQDFVLDPPSEKDYKSSAHLSHDLSCSPTCEDDAKSNHSKPSSKESCGFNSARSETSFIQIADKNNCDNTVYSNETGFIDGEFHKISNAGKSTDSSSAIRDSDRVANKDNKINLDVDRSHVVQCDEQISNPSLEELTPLDSRFSLDSYFYSVSSKSRDSLCSCSNDNVNRVPNTCESVAFKVLESVCDQTLPGLTKYNKRPTNVKDFEIASPQVEIGAHTDAILSEFYSPSDFWLHLLHDGNYGVEAFDIGTLPRLNPSKVKIHQYCLAPLRECRVLHEGYRRAKIVQLLPASEDACVLFFIDYGCKRTVNICDLIEMPLSLFSIPACAIRCCLSGVLHEGHVWNDLAKEMFIKMFDIDPIIYVVAEEKGKFVVKIKYVQLDGVETDLTEYMVLMGFASPVKKNVKNLQFNNIDGCIQEHSDNCSQNVATAPYELEGETKDMEKLQSMSLDYSLHKSRSGDGNDEIIPCDSKHLAADTNDLQLKDLVHCKRKNHDVNKKCSGDFYDSRCPKIAADDFDFENLNYCQLKTRDVVTEENKIYDSKCPAVVAEDFQLKNLNYCQPKSQDNGSEKKNFDFSCLITDVDDFELKSLDDGKHNSFNDVNKDSTEVLYDSGYVTVDINNTEKGEFSSEEAIDLSNLKILSKKEKDLSVSDKKCDEVEKTTEKVFVKDKSRNKMEDFAWDVQIPPPQPTWFRDNFLLVMVWAICSPSEFYVNPACENAADSDSIQEQMDDFYSKKEELKEMTIKAEDLKVGSYCCSQNSVDEHWYRVQVLEVSCSAKEKPKALIQYVDYGDSCVVDVESLRPLTKRFAKYPAFSVLCSLAHIRPKGSSRDNFEEWDESTVERLRSLIGNEKCFTAQIIGNRTLLNGRLALDVLLWDSEHKDKDILINDILLNEGLAELSPEMLKRDQKVHKEDHLLDNWNPIAEDYYRTENSYGVDINDPEIAMVGYKPKDEQYICKHYEMYGTCNFEHCSYQHVTTHHDEVTLDTAEVCYVENQVVLPDSDVYVIGQVSTMINPDHFYLVFPFGTSSIRNIHYLGSKKKGPHVEMEALREAMDSYYSKAPFKELTTVALAYGTIVAAKSEVNKAWLRARVTEVLDVDKPVKVFFVDVGGMEWVRREHIQEIKLEYRLTPFQAVECFLSGVEPKVRGTTNKWSDESRQFFKQLVEGKMLIVHVRAKFGEVLHVDLQLSECDGWIRVTDLLVEQDFASYKPSKFTADCTTIEKNSLQNGDDSDYENGRNVVKRRIVACDLNTPPHPG